MTQSSSSPAGVRQSADVQAWFAKGQRALQAGDLEEAEAAFRQVLSVDPRPWIVQRLPLREFATFANEIAPQNYWRSFNTQPNRDKYAQSGFPVPGDGSITPEFLGDVANAVYGGYGLPISPVGQGAGDVTGVPSVAVAAAG